MLAYKKDADAEFAGGEGKKYIIGELLWKIKLKYLFLNP
jgi:hypothetical protein